MRMNETEVQKYFADQLRKLADEVESGAKVIDELNQEAGMGRVSGAGRAMVQETYTGAITITIRLTDKAKEENFRKEYEANRLEGIPIWMDDAMRR